MGLIDMFKPKEDFTPMGSKAANRTEPFTMGGILQRDPNLSFGQGVQDFKQSFQPTEGFAPLGSAKYQSNLEAARAKRIADTKPESTESISDKQKTETQTESLLPDPKLKGKSFMDKLQSGIETIFTMQTKDPERYARMMSGLDLYSRSQTQDLATALLGNNKFNKDQAAALMQSNMNAMNYKMTVAKYDKAVVDSKKVAMPSEELTKLAQSRLKNEYDIKDENIGFGIAAQAMKELISNPQLTQPEALSIALMKASDAGELKSGKGKFGKGSYNPKLGQSKSIQEVMKKFDMSQEEATQAIIAEGFIPR